MTTRADLFEEIDGLIGPPSWDGSVLEVAVGEGTTSRHILETLDGRGTYVGVDIDPACVDRLVSWTGKDGIANCRAEVADATRALPDGAWDLVVSDTTLNLLGGGAGSFLARARDALVPGGRLVVRELSAPDGSATDYDEFVRAMWAARVHQGERYVCVSRQDVEAMLTALGFSEIRSRESMAADFPLRFEEWVPFSSGGCEFLRDDRLRSGLRSYVVTARSPRLS